MTPKQRRIKHYSRHKKTIVFKRFVIGTLIIVGFLKLIQLGLEYLQLIQFTF